MTKKEKWLKRLHEAQAEERNLRDAVVNGATPEERAAAQETLDKVIEKIADINAIIAELDEPAEGGDNGDGGEGARTGDGDNGEGRGLNVMSTMTQRTVAPVQRNADRYDTEEYRTAFMNFVCRGEAIPANLRATTATTDASAVIPTTILKEIIKEVKSYGNLYSAVRHLNVQGGVQIPILSLMPVATWVGETEASDAQKLQANNNISFSYFGLECKIAQTLLASVTTLEMFQNLFVPLATEAMAKALDIAIMNGTGVNQPTGVTVDPRVPEKNVITLSAADIVDYSAWKKKVFGKMAKAYRNGAFYMAQSTFDGYIDGMVDKNGQPIGRVNYGIDGAETYRFGGKVVETVEDDVIKSYDDAVTGDIIAVFFKATNYAINSNLEMKTVKWVDNDTNEVKNKVILVCDGKLVDPNGVLIIKKGA